MANALKIRENKDLELIEGLKREVRGTRENPFSLSHLVNESTGERMAPSKWLETKRRRDKLTEQSNDIADALERSGISARLDRGNLAFVGLVSGIVHRIEQFRNINLIPDVAQKNRVVYQRELAFFLENHEFARYAVITHGQRIASHAGLRSAMSDFGRKISKWAKICRDDYGINVIARIFEFPRDADGTYHLHANIVYEPFRKLQNHRWQAFLGFTHEFFGTVWKDCGRIENLDELVKYPFKPESLKGASDAEFAWLQRELHKMRIFSAFGDFASWRREYKEQGLKIVTHRGGVVMMRKETFVVRDEDRRHHEDKDRQDLDRDTGELKNPENMVYAVTVPCFMSGPIKEPYVLVKDYREFPKGEGSMSRFADIMMWRHAAMQAWEANGGPDPEVLRTFWKACQVADNVQPLMGRRPQNFRVHNTTITVQRPQTTGTVTQLFGSQKDRLKASTASVPEPSEPRKPPRPLDIFRKPTQNI
jgi:hypothetical protein